MVFGTSLLDGFSSSLKSTLFNPKAFTPSRKPSCSRSTSLLRIRNSNSTSTTITRSTTASSSDLPIESLPSLPSMPDRDWSLVDLHEEKHTDGYPKPGPKVHVAGTEVPEDVFQSLMRAGEKAKQRGQHRMVIVTDLTTSGGTSRRQHLKISQEAAEKQKAPKCIRLQL
mmetsp:Transcript_4873/g.10727  ORF Transcript_4873/g.10727 Transcript_4873/m.10727 type:complete len:169 (+) Transcript_4873:69-575(+)